MIFLTIFATLSLLLPQVSALNCTALPLVVPITNNTLSTGFQRRGIQVWAGTPPQPFSFKGYAGANSTILKQGPITDDNCNRPSDSDAQCIMFKGGIYDRSASTSWSGHMNKEEFKGAPDTRKSLDIMGEETLRLAGIDVKNVPIGIEDSDDVWTSGLGLGTNSSVIERLVRDGGIPSRVWGMDWGWTGATSDMWRDGSLVLGGFDQKKIKDGKLFTQDMPSNDQDTDGCALLVSITGITMKNATSELSLLDSTIRACIQPEAELVTLPYTAFDKFNDAMGGVYTTRSGGFYIWGYESPVDGGYDGTMTITLSNGFRTTIPNHQLIQPYLEFEKTGKTAFKSKDRNVLMLYSLTDANANDLPILGIPFLSATYLVVDPDQRRFQLGEVVGSEESVLVKGSNPECKTTTEEGFVDATTTETPTSEATYSSDGVGGVDATQSSGTSTAAIAGGLVGGVLALVLAAVVLIIMRRKKREAAQAAYDETLKMRDNTHELSGRTFYELSGYSLPQPVYEADSRTIKTGEVETREV